MSVRYDIVANVLADSSPPTFGARRPDVACLPDYKARENALHFEEFERRRVLEEAAAEQAPKANPQADWRDVKLAHPSVRHRIVTVVEQGGGEDTEFMREEVPPWHLAVGIRFTAATKVRQRPSAVSLTFDVSLTVGHRAVPAA